MRLSGTVYSNVLEMDTDITIITPNDLKDEPYQVVYLLHGLCGNNKTWLDYTMLPFYAEHGRSIYVLPEVGRSFYADMQYGQRYFTYIADELPVIVRNVFRVSADRDHTVILGGSMGGYGALKCALSRPEQYGLCGAFSSCCLLLREGLDDAREHGMDGWGVQMPRDFVAIFGDDLTWTPENDLLALAERAKASGSPLPTLYLTCGRQDGFYPDHERFLQSLAGLGIDATFEHWDGVHDFPYFNEALRRTIERFSL